MIELRTFHSYEKDIIGILINDRHILRFSFFNKLKYIEILISEETILDRMVTSDSLFMLIMFFSD